MLFTKVHGLGNDFVIVNGFKEKLADNLPDLARRICHRHTGVGADGLVLLLPTSNADANVRMRILNADGSEPEMCGNAIRCVALYLYKRGLVLDKVIRVDTLAGVIIPEVVEEDGRQMVRVDMGEPRLERNEIPMLGAEGRVVNEELLVNDALYNVTAVSMGNPHCVLTVADLDEIKIGEIGPSIEKHLAFPSKTNVEFIQILNPEHIRMRVWERGVGETMACGTGACAVCVASALNGLTGKSVTVSLNGGDLYIEWAKDNHVYMTGPAEEVFEGKLILR